MVKPIQALSVTVKEFPNRLIFEVMTKTTGVWLVLFWLTAHHLICYKPNRIWKQVDIAVSLLLSSKHGIQHAEQEMLGKA